MGAGCRLALVGATGEVGRAVLSALEDASLPLAEVHALASAASSEETIMFDGRPLLVNDLEQFDFSQADVAIFAVPADVAKTFVPRARDAGCRVIDHSAAFRLESSVPLLMEGETVTNVDLVACPGAVTTLLVPVFKVVADIESVQAMLLSPVSAIGRAGVRELAGQTGELLNGRGIEPSAFPVQIAFNALPVIGEQAGDELMDELERLLPAAFPVALAEVRIPVFYGMTVALQIRTTSDPDLPALRKRLLAQGVNVQLDQGVATPVTDASGQDGVYLSGLQALPAPLRGIQLWLVADNVRQGAAHHSVYILQNWIKDFKY